MECGAQKPRGVSIYGFGARVEWVPPIAGTYPRGRSTVEWPWCELCMNSQSGVWGVVASRRANSRKSGIAGRGARGSMITADVRERPERKRRRQ